MTVYKGGQQAVEDLKEVAIQKKQKQAEDELQRLTVREREAKLKAEIQKREQMIKDLIGNSHSELLHNQHNVHPAMSEFVGATLHSFNIEQPFVQLFDDPFGKQSGDKEDIPKELPPVTPLFKHSTLVEMITERTKGQLLERKYPWLVFYYHRGNASTKLRVRLV